MYGHSSQNCNSVNIEPAVEFAHPLCGGFDADKHGRGHGDESLDRAQCDLEGIFRAADAFKNLQSGTFGSAQGAGRKNGEMGGDLWQAGMKLSPQVLDKLSCRAFHVSH